MVINTKVCSLEEFLERPETQPASELIYGEIDQKPMPQGEHSRLQFKLCAAVNAVTETEKVACALPELRCVFGGHVIVPDVSVFRWDRIPRTESGRVANRFDLPPDWAIEILTLEQSQTKVLEKLLLCLDQGTELGWLIDPAEESVLVVFVEERMRVLRGQMRVPVLDGINLSLTVQEIFSWLQL